VKKWRYLSLLLFLGWGAIGCRPEGGVATPIDPTEARDERGSVITGEDALRLYDIEPAVVGSPEARTPEPWFPMRVWVTASVLPYDDPDPILTLPVYADYQLGVTSTWLGDLVAGSEVVLWSVHVDGRACYIEGDAQQGWEVRGWVACNRLSFEEPGELIDGEGN
jgi:hypothetical protein